jgi:hypothetical protein
MQFTGVGNGCLRLLGGVVGLGETAVLRIIAWVTPLATFALLAQKQADGCDDVYYKNSMSNSKDLNFLF